MQRSSSLSPMAGDGVVQAFVARTGAPAQAGLDIEGPALMVDRWWPAALWLGPATCLVRLDDGPRPELAEVLERALGDAGMEVTDLDVDAPVEAITAQRLGVIGARWRLWATSAAAGRADVAAAAG